MIDYVKFEMLGSCKVVYSTINVEKVDYLKTLDKDDVIILPEGNFKIVNKAIVITATTVVFIVIKA